MTTLLFAIAAVFDGILGIIGLFWTPWLFRTFGVTPPNHVGYTQFPAALLIVFALMFVAVARNPPANRNLILYGMLLKISYCGVVFYHWLGEGLPAMWKPFAVIDLVFLLLFARAYTQLRSPAK